MKSLRERDIVQFIGEKMRELSAKKREITSISLGKNDYARFLGSYNNTNGYELAKATHHQINGIYVFLCKPDNLVRINCKLTEETKKLRKKSIKMRYLSIPCLTKTEFEKFKAAWSVGIPTINKLYTKHYRIL